MDEEGKKVDPKTISSLNDNMEALLLLSSLKEDIEEIEKALKLN